MHLISKDNLCRVHYYSLNLGQTIIKFIWLLEKLDLEGAAADWDSVPDAMMCEKCGKILLLHRNSGVEL